jgi:hypothetical protein
MNTKVSQLGMFGKPIKDQVAGSPGQHNLTAVRNLAQPSASADSLAEITALLAPLGLRGMHGDAQPQRRPARPSLPMTALLHV